MNSGDQQGVSPLTLLNEAQRQAAEAPLGAVMVLAGPGTGKTRTLVARLVHLVNQLAVEPSQIIAVTYTNKATEQMRDRARLALGEAAEEISIGTFHGFCIGILRTHSEVLDLPRFFTVADETCQLEMLRRAVPAVHAEAARGVLLGKISRARLDPERGEKALSAFERDAAQRYRRLLCENCLIDFDDILALMWQLLSNRDEIAREYRKKFQAIVIDEFQDTDPLQYRIFRSLASAHRNIFAVADDDQSIFSWRGAHPQNIDAFLTDFPEARVVRLERTFRSTQEIIRMAGRLMLARRAAPRNLETHREEGEPPQSFAFASEFDEARFIADEIAGRRAANPALHYRDFAVLYARHSIGARLQQILVERGIPAQLVRSKGFFDAPAVRRLLLALQVLINPKDEFALERLAEAELPELEFAAVREHAREGKSGTFRSALRAALARSSTVACAQLRGLLQEIQNLRATIRRRRTSRVSDVVDELVASTARTTADEDEDFAAIIDPLGDPTLAAAAAEVDRFFQRGSIPHVKCVAPLLQSLTQSLADRAGEICSKAGGRRRPKNNRRAPSVFFILSPELLGAAIAKADEEDLIVSLEGSGDIDNMTEQAAGNGAPRVLHIPRSPLRPPESPLSRSVVEPFFRLLQAVVALQLRDDLGDYVALDIETTDADLASAEIIELAAIRVRKGEAVEEALFQFKPEGKISPSAQAVHGISFESLKEKPSFRDEVGKVLDFIGDDLLVAHNGYEFDFPILSRQMKSAAGQGLANATFDTLRLARRLFPHEGASVDALVQKFSLDAGERHRALDDTRVLVQVFERLKHEEMRRRRAQVLCDRADKLVLALALEVGDNFVPFEPCYKKGLTLVLAARSALADQRHEEFPGPFLSERVERLKKCYPEQAILEEAGAKAHFEFRSQLDAMVARFDHLPLEQGIAELLDYVSLFQAQDGLEDRDAVNLLTIYAAKGLEFSQVFVAGLEENVLPSIYALRSAESAKLEEQRRLLYVALTRARDRLVLTWARERDGFRQQPSSFLTELFPTDELAGH